MFKRKSIKNLTSSLIIYCYEVTKVRDWASQLRPNQTKVSSKKAFELS